MKSKGYNPYKRPKYGNKKVIVDGVTYDSKKEYERWCELKILERAGEISNLTRQVKFELIPSQYEQFKRYSEKTGKRLKDGSRCIEKAVTYIADFVYLDKKGNIVVEDTKGIRTTEYVIKRKLMLYIHGIKIIEI